MSIYKKILVSILVLLLLAASAVGGYAAYIYFYLSKGSLDPNDVGANTSLNNQVINVALFGIDGRDDEEVEGDRTDSIMIGTLDLRDHSLKLTSVMRDTFSRLSLPEGVEVEEADTAEEEGDTDPSVEGPESGETTEVLDENGNTVLIQKENNPDFVEYTKINGAYALGDVNASIKTLNENFDLNITDYVTVDFNCLMDVVDAIGGVEVDIPNEDVLYWTNEYLKESNGWGHRNDPDLEHTGVQTLTGAQALAFARNRYSDSDFGRSRRQREVVEGIFNKAKNMDVVTAINLATRLYPYVQTSLSLDQITQYATAVLGSEDLNFQTFQVPTGAHGTSGIIDGTWFLFPDTLIENNYELHKFIYGEDNTYTPSSTVKQIDAVIYDYLENDAYDKNEQIGIDEAPDTQAEATETTEETETDTQ